MQVTEVRRLTMRYLLWTSFLVVLCFFSAKGTLAEKNETETETISSETTINRLAALQLANGAAGMSGMDVEDDALLVSSLALLEEQSKSVKNRSDAPESLDKKEAADRQVIDDVLLGLHTLPADATPWDLLKAQIQADFAPFLIIIPRPVKRYIAERAKLLWAQFRIVAEGPATPMIHAGGTLFNVIGSILVALGTGVQTLARAMSAFGNEQHGGATTTDTHLSAQSTASASTVVVNATSTSTVAATDAEEIEQYVDYVVDVNGDTDDDVTSSGLMMEGEGEDELDLIEI